MMRKKLLIAAVLALVCVLMCGCGEKNEPGCKWLGVWKTDDISIASDLTGVDLQGTSGSITLTLTDDGNNDPDNRGDYRCEVSVTRDGETSKAVKSGSYGVDNDAWPLHVGELEGSRQGDTLVMCIVERENDVSGKVTKETVVKEIVFQKQ